jgi:hypothetical protein
MNISLKHNFLSGWGAPPTPPTLYHKILRDKNIGRKEFRPPQWETFTP